MSAGQVVFDATPAGLTESVARELYGLEAGEVMEAPRERQSIPAKAASAAA
jgi:phosphonate transport system ATP-binding protein